MPPSLGSKTICVDPKQVDLIWPDVSHWIKRAYEYPSDDWFENTEEDVLAGRALLWVTQDLSAAAVSKIWTSGRKICSVLAVGGASNDWPGLLKPIEEYAKREGCHATRLEGRRGWQRVFPDYEQPWIVLEKRL